MTQELEKERAVNTEPLTLEFCQDHSLFFELQNSGDFVRIYEKFEAMGFIWEDGERHRSYNRKRDHEVYLVVTYGIIDTKSHISYVDKDALLCTFRQFPNRYEKPMEKSQRELFNQLAAMIEQRDNIIQEKLATIENRLPPERRMLKLTMGLDQGPDA